jgi:hypothetical protein
VTEVNALAGHLLRLTTLLHLEKRNSQSLGSVRGMLESFTKLEMACKFCKVALLSLTPWLHFGCARKTHFEEMIVYPGISCEYHVDLLVMIMND